MFLRFRMYDLQLCTPLFFMRAQVQVFCYSNRNYSMFRNLESGQASQLTEGLANIHKAMDLIPNTPTMSEIKGKKKFESIMNHTRKTIKGRASPLPRASSKQNNNNV